jgi:membrane-associated protease RseP (regulator of RpoE activity)
VLFVATLGTTALAGAHGAAAGASLTAALVAGLPFCATLLGILLVHEMGHYLLARRHGVDASLPYFIPVPFGPIGTLGAFIRINTAIPSRRAVLDIGAAGPIAGFVVAVPLLFWGFATAEVVTLPLTGANAAWQSPASSLIAWLQGHPLVVETASVPLMGDSVITWLATRLTHGVLPEGRDIALGPVGFAAWIGMYVTALNMIPVGQLDGGHVVYALFGRYAERAARIFLWMLFAMGVFASWSWFVWWVVIRFALGVGHPPAMTDEPLTPRQRTLGLVALLILGATFVPVPFRF